MGNMIDKRDKLILKTLCFGMIQIMSAISIVLEILVEELTDMDKHKITALESEPMKQIKATLQEYIDGE